LAVDPVPVGERELGGDGQGHDRFELHRIPDQDGPPGSPQSTHDRLLSGLPRLVHEQPAQVFAAEVGEQPGQ